jgi:hypothetical protein
MTKEMYAGRKQTHEREFDVFSVVESIEGCAVRDVCYSFLRGPREEIFII